MKNKMPFLSICIPTFNRITRLKNIVINLLCSSLQDIEIVILDNCSTDNTLNVLKEINDKRLSVYSNEENIGGLLNGFRALQHAKGMYSLLCLDKDFINAEKLEDFINILKENLDVNVGHCNFNIAENKKYFRYYAGFDAVIHLAYLSKHPSGNFYNTEKYKNLNILKKIFSENADFVFNIELLNAELASCGNGMIVNVPLIITETVEEAAKVNSLTYNCKNSFFLPKQRIKEYCNYMSHIYDLPLKKEEKIKLLVKVFNQGFFSCTVDFKNIMKNEIISRHYFIEPRKITLTDYIFYGLQYSAAFIKINININYTQKIFIVIKLYYFVILKYIKKLILS